MDHRRLIPTGIIALLISCHLGCARETAPQSRSLGDSDGAQSDGAQSDEGPSEKGQWQVSRELIVVSRKWQAPASIAESNSPGLPSKPAGEIWPVGSSGTDSCLSCHQEQAASYFMTSHARAGRPVKESRMDVPQDWRDERTGRRFEVVHSNGSMEHKETIHLNPAVAMVRQQAKLTFEFGSGTHAHTYLWYDGPFACQSPLTWYTESDRWELSPGYDPLKRPSFERAITTGCVFCHAGRIRVYNENPNHFQIVESAIGCERCHGPGTEHVARHQLQNELSRGGATSLKAGASSQANPTEQDLIINPASLSRSDSEAICSQCHLQGAVLIVGAGRDQWDYRPGRPLWETRTDFQSRSTSDEFRLVGHTEQLHASPCYQESSTLTCITCHDPHRHGASANRQIDFQQACLECHTNESCQVELSIRVERVGNDCSTCHMPKRPTNVTHAALHDHQIGVHAESFQLAALDVPIDRVASVAKTTPTAGPVLFPILDEPALSQREKDRRWALATHHLFFNDRQKPLISGDMERAKSIVLKLNREGHSDADVDATLARDYLDAGMIGPAEQLASAILGQEIGQQDATMNATGILAQIAMQRGDNSDAMQRYQRLTTMRRVAGDHYLLGICRINAGNTQGAVTALLESLRIDPLLEMAHEQLAVLFDHHGDTSRAESHRKALRQTRAYRRSHQATQQGVGSQ